MRKHFKTFLLSLLLLPLLFLVGCGVQSSTIKLTKEMVDLSATEVVYDGTEQKPSLTISTNDEIIPASEYTISYSDNIEVGTATVTITAVEGSEKISGSTSVTFQIVENKNELTAEQLNSEMIYIGYSKTPYNGIEKTPIVKLFTKNHGLIPATEYSVVYTNNKNVGTASVFINANENSEVIKGSVTTTFEITISQAKVKTLEKAQQAIDDTNYSSVILTNNIIIKDSELLTIRKNRTLYTDNNKIENNGKIVNEGQIVSNTQITGTGIIENKGIISATVKSRQELLNALEFATHITLERNISAYDEHNMLRPITIHANNNAYKFTLDLNGYDLECGLEFIAYNTSGDVGLSNTSLNTIIATIKNSKSTESQIGKSNIKNGIYVTGDNHLKLHLEKVVVIGEEYGLYTNKNYSGSIISAKECLFTATQQNNYIESTNTHILGGCGVNLESNASYEFISCNFTGLTGYYARTGNHRLTDCHFIGTGSYCDYQYSEEGAYSDGSAIMTNKTTGYSQTLLISVSGATFHSNYSYGWHDIYTAPDGESSPKEAVRPFVENVDKVKDFTFGEDNTIRINFKSELNNQGDNIVWG